MLENELSEARKHASSQQKEITQRDERISHLNVRLEELQSEIDETLSTLDQVRGELRTHETNSRLYKQESTRTHSNLTHQMEEHSSRAIRAEEKCDELETHLHELKREEEIHRVREEENKRAQ